MIFFSGGILLGTAFTLYLWILYGQLTSAFQRDDQAVPTRIYADATRIAPPQSRSNIETRLQTLGYTPQATSQLLQFDLHPIDYPHYLIPSNHAILESNGSDPSKVTLHFDGEGNSALLQSIEVNGSEVSDLYLEPELIATLTRSENLRNEIRTLLKFEEIPAPVWKAIIATEDQHFLEHRGFDPRGIVRAFWINLRTFSLAQGGSTITQQLVKNLMVRRNKNIFRKINELFLSLLLETRFTKEQILERYLNEVYLGQVGNLEVHGVAEGAEHFFGKKLSDLNLAEIAMMAGLIRGPAYYSPYRYLERANERKQFVLKKMAETGQIAEEESKAALDLPIRLAPPQTVITKAPFYSDYVKAELLRILKGRLNETEISNSGFKVYTTLDSYMNSQAQDALTKGVQEIEKNLGVPPTVRLEGALASVDPTNGFIRALIGGRNYSTSNFNRILNMKRQVGSTFKPIVFLTALEKGEDEKGIPYSPGYPIEDAPWTLVYDSGKRKWSPKNYEKSYSGWISLRKALAESINIPAAKIGNQVGLENIILTARNLGIHSDLPKVPSLTLGVSELSPLELLQVYANLASRGIEHEMTVIRGIAHADGSEYARFLYPSRQVANSASVDLLTDILQTAINEGTGQAARRLGWSRPTAGKTGTTNNYRDAWFAGYTPQMATVVWVGADQLNVKQPRLTGANSALPIWVSFMNKALEDEPPIPFPSSPYLVDVLMDQHTGNEAKSDCDPNQVIAEKFNRNFLPREKSCEPHWPESSSLAPQP